MKFFPVKNIFLKYTWPLALVFRDYLFSETYRSADLTRDTIAKIHVTQMIIVIMKEKLWKIIVMPGTSRRWNKYY